jgi:hypothetical protein
MKNLIKHIIKNIFFSFGLNVSNKLSNHKIEKFFKMFCPHDLGYDLIRIGSTNDGGYLVPNILNNITACLSPGVGHTSSFEDNLLKLGIKSYLLDHTIDKDSNIVKGFDFTKKKLNNYSDANNISLEEFYKSKLKEKDRPILQMDIEGDEYVNILCTNDEILNKFEIMIIEFHYLEKVANEEVYKLYKKTLKKILNNFDVCHIHPNNGPRTFKITKKLKIPQILEVTFLNKRHSKYKKIVSSLPHPLDSKCDKSKPELVLDKFFFN